MSTYTENKAKDHNFEQQIADFTEKYFWSTLNAKRTTDKSEQVRGSDFQIIGSDGKTMIVDEKAKTAGCLNQLLSHPSFELQICNKLGVDQEGWFLKRDSLTTHYAYLAVYTTATKPRDITFENITKVNMLLINKKDIEEMIVDDIAKEAHDLKRDTDIRRDLDELKWWEARDMKTRKNFPHNDYHLTYSFRYDEQPVNLVIKRDKLKALKHTREFEITRNGITKI